MEKYIVNLSKRAVKDLQKIKKSGRKSEIEKINTFFIELESNPREGLGSPEQLKHYGGEVWSRKLNKKDRFVYEIFEQEILVTVVQALGDYDDK